MTQPPPYQQGPYQQQPQWGPPPPVAPPKKPFYKKWWFWVAAVIAVVVIAASAGGKKDDSTDAAASTSSAAAATTTTAPTASVAVTTQAPPPATTQAPDDPLTDGDWTASDIQVDTSNPYVTTLSARLTNNSSGSLSAIFTMTVFGPDGTRLAQAAGSTNDVEGGTAATVTFLASSSDPLPGDPSTYSFELQVDGSY
jgi:hypothetical protein